MNSMKNRYLLNYVAFLRFLDFLGAFVLIRRCFFAIIVAKLGWPFLPICADDDSLIVIPLQQ